MNREPMRVLLDTHALLWFLSGDERLSPRAREIIEDGANEVLTSVACLWEIAIKHTLGRLELDRPFSDLIPAQLEANAIAVLGIELRHVAAVATLPFHHAIRSIVCSLRKRSWRLFQLSAGTNFSIRTASSGSGKTLRCARQRRKRHPVENRPDED